MGCVLCRGGGGGVVWWGKMRAIELFALSTTGLDAVCIRVG